MPLGFAALSVSAAPAAIHPHVSHTGSNGVAEWPAWTFIGRLIGLKPCQAPIFATIECVTCLLVVESACDKQRKKPTVLSPSDYSFNQA